MNNDSSLFHSGQNRIINEKLCEDSRKWPCKICGKVDGEMAHHWKTRGAGGGDTMYNLLPICKNHHVEVHNIGSSTFSKKYKQVWNWLLLNGWEFDKFYNKWIRSVLNE